MDRVILYTVISDNETSRLGRSFDGGGDRRRALREALAWAEVLGDSVDGFNRLEIVKSLSEQEKIK